MTLFEKCNICLTKKNLILMIKTLIMIFILYYKFSINQWLIFHFKKRDGWDRIRDLYVTLASLALDLC